MAPDALQGQEVGLNGHMAGLRQGQLQHQAAAVVRYAPHHVQPPRRARHEYVILPHSNPGSASVGKVQSERMQNTVQPIA